MRKLTRKEVAAISAVLGIFSVGAKHAMACSESGANGQPCTLQTVTVNAYSCPDCEYVPPQWWTPPTPSWDGGSFTAGTSGFSGGTVTPFNPANNPNCSTPPDNKAEIQSYILANEGNDALVSALSKTNYQDPWMNNETGYVPAESYMTPYPNSGVTVMGIDLSNWTPTELEDNGAPASLFTSTVDSLMVHLVWSGGYPGEGTPSPYAPTGSAALNQLYIDTNAGATPLFTATGAQEIFQAGYNAILGAVQSNIGTVPFGQLPNGTQEGIMDYAFNADGGNLYKNPTLLGYIKNEDWLSLGEYLLGMKRIRFATDGAAILTDIREGKLPEQGGPC
jgi:hypothetical protein